MVPEPVVIHRSWNYQYTRPRRMGWPVLTRTGWPERDRSDSRIEPRKITVQVRQEGSGWPELSSIQVSGLWAGTTLTASEQIRLDAKPGLAFTIYATDWVTELAADAVGRARKEAESNC